MPFYFSEKIEDLLENEKLLMIVSSLLDETKRILNMKFIDNYNSKGIADIVKKSTAGFDIFLMIH